MATKQSRRQHPTRFDPDRQPIPLWQAIVLLIALAVCTAVLCYAMLNMVL